MSNKIVQVHQKSSNAPKKVRMNQKIVRMHQKTYVQQAKK